MTETLWRVEQVHGNELSFPVGKSEALDQVRRRMDVEPLGDPLRIVRIDYRLDPDEPPGHYTPAMRVVWRQTIVKFPKIGTLGVCVCKDASQHRFGNAGDWAAPSGSNDAQTIAFLWDVFAWHRDSGIEFEQTNGRRGLPVSEVIFRDKISTRAHDWTIRPYTGTFHAAHEHGSCYPLIDTSRPCTC